MMSDVFEINNGIFVLIALAAVGHLRHPPTGEPYVNNKNGAMVKTFQAYLANCHRFYSCVHCRAHLANHDELISKVYTLKKSFVFSPSFILKVL